MKSTSSLKRILLKISGESFGTHEPFEFSHTDFIVEQIAQVYMQKIELAVVMGGGNIVRGAVLEQRGIPRVTGDCMGMLATLINALVLSKLLEARGVKTRIVTSLAVEGIGEVYNHERCLEYLDRGIAILFATGTGHPYFTTDTAAALRALEIKAQCLLKGTKVDGVYSGDNISQAHKFDRISYREILENQYHVMDLTAVAFCWEHHIPIRVFNLMKPGNLMRIIEDESIGTSIGD